MNTYRPDQFVIALFYLAFTTLLALLPTSSYAATAEATVDRKEITIEETLNLNIRLINGDRTPSPDLTDLEINFEILKQGRSNQYRSFNGQVESWVEWSLVIAPKKTGKLLIPSFNLGGEFTTPIEITVEEARPLNLSDGQLRDIFLETDINPKGAFVQQQILVTLRLNMAVPVSTINREDLKIPNAKVEAVDEQRFTRTIKGREYAVVELTFAIYPQESGKLKIPSMTWQATLGTRTTSLFDFRSRRNSQRRLLSEAFELDVKAKPDSYTGDTWLPARDLSISESWSQNLSDFTQGEPIIRRITLTAEGLTGSQLPDLEINYPDGINHYPEPSSIDEQKNERGITTRATQVQALLVTQPGTYTFPAIELTWWNTQSQQEENVELPARTVHVKASGNAAAPPPLQTAPSQPNTNNQPSEPELSVPEITTKNNATPWLLIISNLVTALVIIVIGYFWLKSRKSTTATNEQSSSASHLAPEENASNKQLIKQLRATCQSQNPESVRLTILHICRRQVPNQPASLHTLAEHLRDAEAIAELHNLDQKLFNERFTGSVNYSVIEKAISQLMDSDNKNKNADVLPPLNPKIGL